MHGLTAFVGCVVAYQNGKGRRGTVYWVDSSEDDIGVSCCGGMDAKDGESCVVVTKEKVLGVLNRICQVMEAQKQRPAEWR